MVETNIPMADAVPQTGSQPPDASIPDVSTAQSTCGKRKAETELEREAKLAPSTDDGSERGGPVEAEAQNNTPGAPLSKNQLKRLRRQQQYQAYKEERKVKRKDKRHARQERKRAERDAKIAEAEAAGLDPKEALRPQGELWAPKPVRLAFVIDCDFEGYMRDAEIVSLSSQITRSYSQNRKARYQGHFFVSSWKGKLQERFETTLEKAHERWKNVHILKGDFREAAREAAQIMAGEKGGEVIDLITPRENDPAVVYGEGEGAGSTAPEEDKELDQSVVYLSSESPYTLKRLEPNTTYVIGGLVDRNREKGLCYKRAKDYKVRTAKLPIGEYMKMQDRFVLTTNQVVEIMVKWLECGDWAEAFLDVIPKRKGGTLKVEGSQVDADDTANLEGETMVEDVTESAGDAPPPIAQV
ncbi:guanine-1-methyltransferase-domain-containing protein [Podospora aff. communis PSN243]|uniref:tRNA (guanine(9)-N1)-methyltransferase n=1 Tax=Podospora aff. communis PSN243 TaxID=3040156 RepID=A0AAV9GHT6_9PEZI|nr:guanine-1-methyltransferase-domain-containing protein [Podospora aff. communis PSN243]